MNGKTCAPRSQWGHPRGWRGRLVGALMAAKNRAINEAALAELAPAAGERVLEVGCGPGWALRRLASMRPAVGVTGLDHSSAMVAAARRRNRCHLCSGRMSIRQGDVAVMPFADGAFDAVLAVNTVHFWPTEAFAEIRRVLTPGGRVLVAVRAAERAPLFDPAGAGFGTARAQDAAEALAAAGLEGVEVGHHRAGNRTVLCVRARRPVAAAIAA